MERKENRATKGLSVRLCFRPSSVPQKTGRLYYQIIIRRSCYQHNSLYQIYDTEWSRHTGIIIKDVVSPRGIELMAIKKHTEWETAKIYEVAQSMLNETDSIDYDLIVHGFETQKAQQSLRSYVTDLITRLEQKGKTRTAETYLSTYRSFMRFLKKDDIFLYEIDQNMIEDYEIWLQKEGLTPNSTSFYI